MDPILHRYQGIFLLIVVVEGVDIRDEGECSVVVVLVECHLLQEVGEAVAVVGDTLIISPINNQILLMHPLQEVIVTVRKTKTIIFREMFMGTVVEVMLAQEWAWDVV
jgi:hypothetical protein